MARSYSARRNSRFSAGTIPENSHIKIIDAYPMAEGEILSYSRYRVEYPCCGRVETIQHRSIMRRCKSGYVRCKECAWSKNRNKLGGAVTPSRSPAAESVPAADHDWPVMTRELIGRTVPSYDRGWEVVFPPGG